jgi:hypothetical protein
MLNRICLIVAILAGLLVGGLNLVRIKGRITGLQSALGTQIAARHAAETDLSNTRSSLENATVELKKTRAAFETAKREQAKAFAEAAEQSSRANELSQEVNQANHARDEAQAYLARYKASSMEPEEVVRIGTVLNQFRGELALIQQENKNLTRQVSNLKKRIPYDESPVWLPTDLKSHVVAVDPKWEFVVLNSGEDQGVLEHGELLINRQGRLVAKVKVSLVEKDHCVATVVPGWKLADVLEGDLAITASPGRRAGL